VIPLSSDWLSSEEDPEPTRPALAVSCAPSMGLDELINKGAAGAKDEEEEDEFTVSKAALLQALPPSLDTRHLKRALLSVEVT
jgi:hypothetical protein